MPQGVSLRCCHRFIDFPYIIQLVKEGGLKIVFSALPLIYLRVSRGRCR